MTTKHAHQARDAKIKAERFYRELRLDAAGVDLEARTVPASLSSELAVERWFGREVLQHNADAVDLSRADGGLPLLFSHDPQRLIGSVRDVRLEDGKLRGTLHFGRSVDATERWQDVIDGHLRSISIGYSIDEWTETKGSDLVEVTRWTLLEASTVAIPADPTVGINRKYEGRTMEEHEGEGAEGAVEQVRETVSASRAQAEAAGVKRERARIDSIMARFAPWIGRGEEYLALRDKCIQDGTKAERAADLLLELAAGDAAPIANVEPEGAFRQARAHAPASSERAPLIVAGRTELEGWKREAELNIRVRANLATPDEVREFGGCSTRGMTLVDLARDFLRLRGLDYRGSKMEIVGRAFTVRATSPMVNHSTDDFAGILIDAANKSLNVGFEEAPETWSRWAKKGSTGDFKRFHRTNLSTGSDLDVVPEGAEYKYGTLSDIREYGQLKTYGKLFAITRQAIINDDLSAFTEIPRIYGRAASRMVGDEVYGVLTSNPTLNQDSLALFHATHGNYVTAGGAPSVTTVDAGFVAMATRTDPAGNVLNIRPAFLLCPVALENTSKVLVTATYDPAGSAGTLKPNPINGRLEVVADARLDAADNNGWYLAANPAMASTIEAVFLDGNETPYLEQQNTFTVDGVAFKVRLDVVALATDFRGLYFNDGE